MNTMIKKFYEDCRFPEFLMEDILGKFEKNPDIAREFEYWIENKDFNTENAIEIEGYTAKSLAEKSEYLNGEGAFTMLIELRENPQNALKQLAKGLKQK